MEVITHKHYDMVKSKLGYYVRFKFNSLPYEKIIVGKIDSNKAEELLPILEERKEVNVKNDQYQHLSNVLSNIFTFLPIGTNLYGINNVSSIGVYYEMKQRLYAKTTIKEGKIGDIRYRYTYIGDNIPHGLVIFIAPSLLIVYACVEGRCISYMTVDFDISIEDMTIDLFYKKTNSIGFGYYHADNITMLRIGSNRIAYDPNVDVMDINGFRVHNIEKEHLPIFKFVTVGGESKSIWLEATEHWWKYCNIYYNTSELTSHFNL